MHIFIVYAHPSEESFTHSVLLAFINGLNYSNHTYEISDLYKMNFRSDMELDEYERESGRESSRTIPEDVKLEQEKINKSDALVLIYPVWWSDCPAKLKGWFDRVYTLGFAYAYENGKHAEACFKVKKALVICAAGHTVEYLEEIGIAESMRTVMLRDRLLGVGAEQAEMVILGGMVSKDYEVRERNLKIAFDIGMNINISV
ncbi:NADPH:quinone reductase [Desulfosporosinus sp. Tol-M]|jgi:Putative NADPH-quinone reductase (modulator of drug activity B)|nr:NADPH:quinone reductase [Desulfosporosinus sp. Tol-M]